MLQTPVHRCKRCAVASSELAKPVDGRWRTGLDRLVAEMAQHVGGEVAGRVVAARAVLFEGLHHDPVEVALDDLAQPAGIHLAMGRRGRAGFAQRAEARAGLGRLLFADDAADFVKGRGRIRSWSNGVVPVRSS